MAKIFTIILSLLFLYKSSFGQEQRFHGQKIVGYIPSYGDAKDVNYAGLTHAMYAFVFENPDGTIKPMDSWTKVLFNKYLAATKDAGTRRIVSIATDIGEVAKNANAIHTFADTIVKFCKHFGFEGVDIDWEGMSSDEETTHYGQLMDTLEKHLHPAGLSLVATVGYGDYWMQWYPDAALKKADWMQIMIYDMTGTWASSPFGNHSSYDHFMDAEAYWINRGYNRDKLVMGVPFYGRKFSSSKGGLAPAVSYKDIVSQFPQLCDTSTVTPGKDYDFFNGPALIRKKAQYLIDHHFGGIMIWEMTQDAAGDRSLHKQIVCTYEGKNCPEVSCRTTAAVQAQEANADIFVSEDTRHLEIHLKEGGKCLVYFHDLLGRQISFSETMLNGNGASVALPEADGHIVFCRLMINDKVYTKKIWVR